MYVISLLFLGFASTWANPAIFNGRIIGGEVAEDKQFPWQVFILVYTPYNIIHSCNGALVSKYWVVTSSHCLEKDSNYTLSFGSNSRTKNDPNKVTVETNVTFTPPRYTPSFYRHDVGLIKIVTEYEGNDQIQPIRLSSENLESNTTVTLSSWGTTNDENKEIAEDLHYINLTTISNEECTEYYGKQRIIDELVCTVGETNEGACLGDNGAPLVIFDDDGLPVHVGLVSFVNALGCEYNFPTGFTRTSFYTEWVAETIEKNS